MWLTPASQRALTDELSSYLGHDIDDANLIKYDVIPFESTKKLNMKYVKYPQWKFNNRKQPQSKIKFKISIKYELARKAYKYLAVITEDQLNLNLQIESTANRLKHKLFNTTCEVETLKSSFKLYVGIL